MSPSVGPVGPTPDAGWRPLGRGGAAAPTVSAFARLARTHALAASGDALVAVGLAGSLFFSIAPEAARGRVALYLVLTMAPFAVVAPFLGPLIDRRRGGRRQTVILAAAARAVVCVLMARHLDSLLLFPEAFAVLVLGKSYGVAKAALVPGVVSEAAELVQANSRLSLIAGMAGFTAAPAGVALLQLGPAWVLGGASAAFAGAALAGLRIPPARPSGPLVAAERAELRASGILLAATAMAVLRSVVGFLSFLLAFSLRAEDAPTWWFGLTLGASGIGALVGAAVAPGLRRRVREERVLLGCLVAVSVAAVVALQLGGRPAGLVLGVVVGVAGSAGRLCFDAIVQRDAPDADQARTFARFEARFQLAWVAGALVPVVLSLSRPSGFLAIAGAGGAAAVSYLTGRRPLLAIRKRLGR